MFKKQYYRYKTMKNKIIELQKELEPYYKELEKECDLMPLLYENIDMMLRYDISDEAIQNWLTINKDAISFIREKLEKLKARS